MTLTARAMVLFPAAVMLGGWPGAPAQSDDVQLATYHARYQVEYKGRKVGFAELSVSYDSSGDAYRFESRTAATGLAKLLRPNAAVERSEFLLRDNTIVPTAYEFDDGTRKGEDDVTIAYNWSAGTASVTTAEGVVQLPLKPGVLDRGAMQVALMHDLDGRRNPGPYVLADGDSLKTYRYTVGDRASLPTPAGTFDTLELTQEREGSSRTTRLWVAPALANLPVRIEQLRGGEVQTSITLESVEGL